MKRRTASSAAPQARTDAPDWERGGPPVPGTGLAAADPEDDAWGPMPDAERLVAEAVRLAGDDLDTARLVSRYWRFAPDEELVGLSPAELVAEARTHRDLAHQRVPGELRLRVADTPDGELTKLEIVADDMPFLV